MNQIKNCIFCEIIHRNDTVKKIYEDDSFICIYDLYPQAKIHFLVIPKQHLSSLEEAFPMHSFSNCMLMGKMLEVATKVARQEKLLPEGFRIVLNTGASAGQSIFHIHLHILGGELLSPQFA